VSVFNESVVEEAALAWFGELGYAIGHGPDLAAKHQKIALYRRW